MVSGSKQTAPSFSRDAKPNSSRHQRHFKPDTAKNALAGHQFQNCSSSATSPSSWRKDEGFWNWLNKCFLYYKSSDPVKICLWILLNHDICNAQPQPGQQQIGGSGQKQVSRPGMKRRNRTQQREKSWPASLRCCLKPGEKGGLTLFFIP